MPEHGIDTNIPHREASAFYPLLAEVGTVSFLYTFCGTYAADRVASRAAIVLALQEHTSLNLRLASIEAFSHS